MTASKTTKRYDLTTPDDIRDWAMERFGAIAPKKYDKGQKEHGGVITERDSLAEIESEVVDLWFYIQSLRIKLGHLK